MTEEKIDELLHKMNERNQTNLYDLYKDFSTIDLENETCQLEVMYKPKWSNYVTLVCAVLFLFTGKIYGFIFAIILFVATYYILFVMKDKKALGIYGSFVILYQPSNDSKAVKLKYSDIIEWGCEENQPVVDGMYFKTAEVVYHAETYRVSQAFNKLIDIIPEKEARRSKSKRGSKKKKS